MVGVVSGALALAPEISTARVEIRTLGVEPQVISTMAGPPLLGATALRTLAAVRAEEISLLELGDLAYVS